MPTLQIKNLWLREVNCPRSHSSKFAAQGFTSSQPESRIPDFNLDSKVIFYFILFYYDTLDPHLPNPVLEGPGDR